MSPIWLAIETATETPISPAPALVIDHEHGADKRRADPARSGPDHVFFGLTVGQNFGPPIIRPAKYPTTSVTTTTSTSQSIQLETEVVAHLTSCRSQPAEPERRKS